MPVVVGALARLAAHLFGRHGAAGRGDRGGLDRTPSPIRSRRCASTTPPCQEVVITGDALRAPGQGLAALPVPISTPGFDAAPYLTATLAVTRDPETGIQNMGTYRAGLKATDRLGVRMAARIGGAGGYQHWRKHNKRKTPMPCAFVIGAAPVVMFTGPMKLADRSRRDGGRGRARGRADPGHQMRHRRSRRAGRRRDRDRRPDRSGAARARRPVRREPRPHRARRLQHVDAGDRDHPQAQAGVRLDPQRGDAERIERGQEGRLRADVPRRICATSSRSRACAAW